MLVRSSRQSGVSLIELLVGIALVAILLGIGASSFRNWIQNTQIRTAAETIQNGLQVARAEAVKQNKSVQFQLMSSIDNSCAPSTTVGSWVVSELVADGKCASAPSNTAAAPDPRIIQSRNGAEGSPNAVLEASQSSVAFNSLGRVTNAAGANVLINVTNPNGGDCAVAGPMRCLRVVVSVGGQIRMCDPAVTVSTDSRFCP